MKLNVLLDPSLVPVVGTPWSIQHPDDSTECVFMARAVHELGRAKYGPLWTGNEPHTQLPDLLPDALDPMHYNALWNPEAANNSDEPVQWFDPPSRAVLERAYDLLSVHRPDLEKPSRFAGMFGGLSLRPLRFTIREWKIAQGLAKKERDECLAALGRWFDLQKDIVSFCESGLLVSLLRPLVGGDFSDPLPKSFWRCEKYAARFVIFMMHPVHPFKTDTNRQEGQWIFFTKVSLRLALSKIHGVKPSAPLDEAQTYESELLQHMRKVSRALAISAENPPKKVEVAEAIVRLWEGDKPLSKPDVEHMASFIRPLASRGGRNTSIASQR